MCIVPPNFKELPFEVVSPKVLDRPSLWRRAVGWFMFDHQTVGPDGHVYIAPRVFGGYAPLQKTPWYRGPHRK
jgi:hypothetical protein